MNMFYKSDIETNLLCMNQLGFTTNIIKMINKTHLDYLNAGIMYKLYVDFIFDGSGDLYTTNFQWHCK